MTNKFYQAIPYIFEHEGGFSDLKSDKGGATNWGVSLRLLKAINDDINKDGVIDYLDIKLLPKEHATEIYYYNFWKPFYEALPDRLAAKLFDTAVNAGHYRSNILFQQALNSLGSNLKEDGLIGRGTIAEILKYTEQNILTQYAFSQKKFYDALVVKDTSQEKFIKGWTKRASWLPK